MNIDEIKQKTFSACQQYNVERLYLFGSVARGCSSSESDIDLLVEFKNPGYHPAKRFFGFLHLLEDTFQCKIDLLSMNGLKNPYIKEQIDKEKVLVYEG